MVNYLKFLMEGADNHVVWVVAPDIALGHSVAAERSTWSTERRRAQAI